MHPECLHGRHDRHDRSAVVRRAHRPGHHVRARRHRYDDRQEAHRDPWHQGLRVRHRADQSSVWASSPDWVAAYPEVLRDRLARGHGRQVDAVLKSCCHLNQDVAHAAGPFPVRRRTGCSRGVGHRNAGHLDPEHREARRWNQDAVAAEQPGPRQPERRAQPDLGRGARLGAEPASAVSEPVAELVAPLAAPGQPVRTMQPVRRAQRAPQLWVRWLRSPPVPRPAPRQKLAGLPPAHRRSPSWRQTPS
jgi:hypothetical protein